MKSFRIPLVWQMYGHMWVDAETEEEAIKIALGSETPLPEGNYVDDSIGVDDCCEIEMNELTNVEYVKHEYFEDGVVMSELIRSMLQHHEVELTIDEINELLQWSGDDEYITAQEILDDIVYENVVS